MYLNKVINIVILTGLSAMLAHAEISCAATIVKTSGGEVRSVAQKSTEAFFAIPYARPPVGELRWKPPLAAEPWQGVRSTTQPSPACYQSAPKEFGPFTPEFLIPGPVSEDCLYLNIWRRTATVGKRPVFFYIHGGGFGSGATSVPIYDGKGLAERGVIVVTINYRLGAFGFLAHPSLTQEGQGSSGNYGLLDMIAALRWVRVNIARFGGDPDNITIAGQSAGAAAVSDLLLSPQAKGLFHRAIAQSGAGMGVTTAPLDKAEQYGLQIAQQAGVQTIEQLRQLSAAKLQQLAETPPPGAGTSRLPSIRFAPNVDGIVLLANPEQPKVKVVSNVPFLTGFNSDEGLVFGAPKTPTEFEAYVRDRYGDFSERILALYPHADDAQVADSIPVLARDRYMASLVIWAQDRAASSNQKVYTYVYEHPYPSANGVAFGAFHTAEVPYVMGALGKGHRTFTAKDEEFSRAMQNQWLAFMRNGDPSQSGARWSPVSATNQRLMTVGPNSRLVPAVSTEARLDLFREFVHSGGRLSLL